MALSSGCDVISTYSSLTFLCLAGVAALLTGRASSQNVYEDRITVGEYLCFPSPGSNGGLTHVKCNGGASSWVTWAQDEQVNEPGPQNEQGSEQGSEPGATALLRGRGAWNQVLNLDEIGMPHLELLSLDDTEIKAILPTTSETSLGNLTTFRLTRSLLWRIDDMLFSKLSRLDVLDLSCNQITQVSRSAFVGLSRLCDLTLSKNNIRRLPCDLFAGMDSLQTLLLDQNGLEELSECVFGEALLPALLHLRLQSNRITTLTPGTFSSTRSLLSLDLGRNRLATVTSYVFEQLQSLEELLLHDNLITDLQSHAFAGLLQLQRLNLEGNMLSALGGLQHLSNLRSLSLTGNPMSQLPPDGFSNLTSLRELYLNRMAELSTLKQNSLRGLTDLWKLELQGCEKLGVVQTNVAPSGELRSLEQIDLSGNNMASIDNEFLKSLPSLWLAKTGDNPYLCDCSVAWIAQAARRPVDVERRPWLTLWLTATQDVNSPRCSAPAHVKGRRIVDLDPRDLTCQPPVITVEDGGPSHVVGRGEEIRLTARLSGGFPRARWILPDGTVIESKHSLVMTQPTVIVKASQVLENERQIVVKLTLTNIAVRPNMCGRIQLVATNVASTSTEYFVVRCNGAGSQMVAPLHMDSKMLVHKGTSGSKAAMIVVAMVALIVGVMIAVYWKYPRKYRYVRLRSQLLGNREEYDEIPGQTRT